MQLLHNSRDLHAEETDVRIAVNVGERMVTASAAGWKQWLALTLHADRQWDDGSPMSSAQGLGDVPERCKRCPTQKKEGSSGRLRASSPRRQRRSDRLWAAAERGVWTGAVGTGVASDRLSVGEFYARTCVATGSAAPGSQYGCGVWRLSH
jgi:hypothetical protein